MSERGADSPNAATTSSMTSPGVSTTTPPAGAAVPATTTTAAAAELCAGCQKPITERYLLRALDRQWHEDCLRCSCCDCRLGEVGSTLFTRSNLLLCRRDYLRLFGVTGYCSACSKMIPAFEMIMRAKDNVYHLECFACHRCSQRFCIGDKYYLCDNRILCEYDYEEQRALFAAAAVAAASSPSSLHPAPPLLSSGASPGAVGIQPRLAAVAVRNGQSVAGGCGAALAQMKRQAAAQHHHHHMTQQQQQQQQQQQLHHQQLLQQQAAAAAMDTCVKW